MLEKVIFIILTVAGFLYQSKYAIQVYKINRLQSSKGVARTYFWISIIYELVCTVGAIILHNWLLLVLSVLPLIGNTIVFVVAVKYAPYSRKKDLKHRLYNFIRNWT